MTARVPTVGHATEILLHAFALADAAGLKGELCLHPSVPPDVLLTWADRRSIFVASEELTRVSCGVTIRWTLYSVTLPGGSVVTAHGADGERSVAPHAAEPDVLPAVSL